MHEYKQWILRIIENNNKATNLHLNKKTATVASRYAIKGLFSHFSLGSDLSLTHVRTDLGVTQDRLCLTQYRFSFLTTERAVTTGRGD